MKPQPKREVMIRWMDKDSRRIHLDATLDVVDDIAAFGDVYYLNANRYSLRVDTRYDFDEVVAYIENYEES